MLNIKLSAPSFGLWQYTPQNSQSYKVSKKVHSVNINYIKINIKRSVMIVFNTKYIIQDLMLCYGYEFRKKYNLRSDVWLRHVKSAEVIVLRVVYDIQEGLNNRRF